MDRELSDSATADCLQLSGAEMLIRSLQEEGVEQVFGYPGAVLHIYDALFKQEKVKHHSYVTSKRLRIWLMDTRERLENSVVLVTSGQGRQTPSPALQPRTWIPSRWL